MNQFPGPNGQGDADRTLGNLEIVLSQVTIDVDRRAFAWRTAEANAAASIDRARTSVKRMPKSPRATPIYRWRDSDGARRCPDGSTTTRVGADVTRTFRHSRTDHFETCPFLESDTSRRFHLAEVTCERPVKVLGRVLEGENHPHSWPRTYQMAGVTATSPTKETGPRRERG